MQWLVDHNPFAIFLRLISEPLMGQVPATHLYVEAGLITVGCTVVAAVALVRYRHRIIYWL
jgi:lipopolysaccharide transport system permease protein